MPIETWGIGDWLRSPVRMELSSAPSMRPHAAAGWGAATPVPVALGLLEAAPEAMLVIDPSGVVALANRRTEDLLRKPRAALIGAPVGAVLPGADEALGADGAVCVQARRGDGTELPVDVSTSALDAGAGAIVIVRDAAERLRIEEELRLSRSRLHEAEQSARIGSWEWDIRAGVLTWSDELFRIYGVEPQSFEPTYEKFLQRVHPEDRDLVDARTRKALADHQPFEDIERVTRPDGSVVVMRTQGEVVLNASGSPVRMIGICEDVTVSVRAQEAEARLAAIVQSAGDGIYTLDLDSRITSWNPGAERLYGYAAREAVGQSIELILPEERLQEESCHRREAIAGRTERWEAERVRKDGARIAVSVTMSPLFDAAGTVTGISAVARDVTERRRIESRLEYLAHHDALTGLFNRRRFEEELGAACARAGRTGRLGALLLLDVDNFKYVNDTFGHHAGDELLAGVAGVLSQRLRESDTLARLGGDEFAILAAPAGLEEAGALANGLLALVREYAMTIDRQTVRTTVSIGVVSFDGTCRSTDELLADVDRAMYESKAAGRDRATIHTPDRRRRARAGMRISWEHHIRRALDEDGFELYCQPIVELATGRMSHCELLLRMRIDGELVLPGVFLAVAERSGQIHAIDRWVIARAIEVSQAHPQLGIEINLSGRTTDDKQLVGYIDALLRERGVDPAKLVFEITETAAIGNIGQARELAGSLSKIGCKFALDDFGAGFSSFYYLKNLPAHYLKIDGDFVSAPRTRTDELVIESIVRIARELGKQTIAEFVHDEATLACIRALGVDYGQGFHIARPFPVSELDERWWE